MHFISCSFSWLASESLLVFKKKRSMRIFVSAIWLSAVNALPYLGTQCQGIVDFDISANSSVVSDIEAEINAFFNFNLFVLRKHLSSINNYCSYNGSTMSVSLAPIHVFV